MIDRIRALLVQARTDRDGVVEQLKGLLAAADADGRAELTAEEEARWAELRKRLGELDDRIADLEAREAEIAAVADRESRLDQAAADAGVGRHPEVRVTRDEPVYRPDAGPGFLSDLYAARVLGDPAAAERISRHQAAEVERRDIAAAALAGTIPPQYLVDRYAALARAGRPFLNQLRSLPLPEVGTSLVVPRVTTGTSAAMVAENAAFSETDAAVTDDTVTVNLIGGQQDVSRAIFQRGGRVVDDILFPDLIAAANTVLDSQALNGSGTAPNHRGVRNVTGINSVTYTDTTPTVPELWPKIADAIQRINSARFLPADLIVMHPRRWGWLTAALDTQNRPLFSPNTPPPVTVVSEGAAAGTDVVGTVMGLPVVIDANVPTNLGAGSNEDVIIVLRSADVLWMEDPLMQFTFEQTLGPQTVRIAVARFSAFHAGRWPAGISVIGGTGLVTPTF